MTVQSKLTQTLVEPQEQPQTLTRVPMTRPKTLRTLETILLMHPPSVTDKAIKIKMKVLQIQIKTETLETR